MMEGRNTYSASLEARGRRLGYWGCIFAGLREDLPPGARDPSMTMRFLVREFWSTA